MFDIGLMEFVVLAIAALFIFGPNRLPEVAAKAARGLRQLRQMAVNARRDLAQELGPEFENFDPSDLNPRNAIKKYVLDGVDEDDLRIDKDIDLRADLDTLDKPATSKLSEPSEPSEPSERGATTDDRAGVNGASVAESNGDQAAATGSASDAASTASSPSGTTQHTTKAQSASGAVATTAYVPPPFDPEAT
ncbi:MAG TPA: sec-independent translocase [Actinopolymorphaceae bacterium]